MLVMGVRCSNSDYSYCILSGSRDAPTVEVSQQVSFPKGYSESEILRWLYQEMKTVFRTYTCDAVGIKRPEIVAKRSNALESRLQSGAIVILAAAESGCRAVHRKVKSTIAKDLGLKGKGRYLDSKLDTSAINGFNSYPKKIQEAILIAWSCM